MSNADIYNAFCEVDDDLLLRSEESGKSKVIPLKRRVVLAAAAVLVVVVLMGAAVVVNHWDSIQSWVAHRWEMTTGDELSEYQTDLIDSLSYEIGVSQTVNGVTVTVDSAALLGDSISVLLRVDGLEIPEAGRVDIGYFEKMINDISDMRYSMGELGYDDGSVIIPLIFNDCQIDNEELYVDVQIVIDDFTVFPTGDVLGDGKWVLSFSVQNADVEVIELSDTEVIADYMIGKVRVEPIAEEDKFEFGEMPITITDVKLTNFALTFKYAYDDGGFGYPNSDYDVKILFLQTKAYAVMADGTEIESDGQHGSGETTDSSDYLADMTLSMYWPAPINIDEVVEIRIGDTVIPVK